jgi:pyruvate dehydrogenase E2 component (dihydrolipoamide acetyltransferase)
VPVILMPRLSDAMEEATIVRWLKAPGDDIAIGDELVEIETDKATVTYEADCSGRLDILAAEGETVALGAPICALGDGSTPASNGGPRVSASPVARRMALAAGLELAAVPGTGPNGRIVKADVEALLGATPRDEVTLRDDATPPVLDSPPPVVLSPVDRVSATVEPLARARQVVAERTTAAKATQPEFSLEVDVAMDALVALRETLREMDGVDRVPSVNDFVVKASALALRAHPRANARYRDGAIERFADVHVGIAIAAPEALLVATVANADQCGLGKIAEVTRDLAARARSGALTPAELSGSTFTVSNLGMYGITRMTPILNSGQAAILGVGAMAARPRVVDGALGVGQSLSLTLVSDPRVLDGAEAAEVLASIRSGLEAPLRLLL